MKAWAIASAVAAALTAGCGIPQRDNPEDPVNRPLASLRIVDRGVSRISDDACAPFDPAERNAWVEVLSVDRGACLALDAADSDGPPGAELSFAFHVVPDDEEEALPFEIVVAGSAGLISPAQLRLLPLDEPSTFEVVVRAGDAADRKTARLEVRNPLPTAVLGPDRAFAIQAGGVDVDVALDGSASFDADGDDIESFAWTVPADFVVDGCGNEATCTLRVPRTAPLSVPVRLAVSDGSAFSSVDQMLVEVRRFGPVVRLSNPDDRVAELDPERRKYPQTTSVAFPLHPDGSQRVVFRGVFDTVTLGEWPDGDPLDTIDLPSTTVIGGESDLVWDTTPTRPIRITAGDTLTPLATVPTDPTIEYERWRLVDGSGALWGTIPLSYGGPEARLLAMNTAGQLAPIDALTNLFVVGIAARPRTSEVWSLQTRNAVVAGSDGPSVFVRHTIASGAITSTVYALDATDVSAFAFGDTDTIWALSQDGLHQVDVTALQSGVALAGATTRLVPSILAGSVHGAPSGGCVVVAGSMLSRVGADGVVSTSIGTAADTFVPQPDAGEVSVDPAGNVWWESGSEVIRIRSFDGLLRRSSIPLTNATTMDPDGGAMIVTGPSVLGVRRMAVDGTIERSWTDLVIGTQTSPVPLAIPARDPDAETGWVVALSTTGGTDYAGQLYRVDFGAAGAALPATPVGAPYPVSDATSATNLYDMRSRGDELWQWEIDFIALTSAVFRVNAAGTRTNDLVRNTNEIVISASFAPDGSEGCALTIDTSDQMRMYRVVPGSEIFLNVVAIGGFNGPHFAAWAPGQCWAVRTNGSDTLELYGFTGTGIAPITTTAPYGNGVTDFAATGVSDVWVLGRPSPSSVDERVDRFTFDGVAWRRTPFEAFPENFLR